MLWRVSLLVVAVWCHAAVWATTHQVYVGNANGATVYTPNNFNASVNDTIIFIYLGSHSVTRTTFSEPCAINTAASAQDGGFDSGILGTGSNFSIVVEDPQPIWIRCNSHCAFGMVAAINAPSSGNDTFQAFQSGANQTLTSSTTAAPSSTQISSTSTGQPTTTTSKGGATILRPDASLLSLLVVSIVLWIS